MRTFRFAVVLLLVAGVAAGTAAADSIPETIAALRKAKTKDDRAASLHTFSPT